MNNIILANYTQGHEIQTIYNVTVPHVMLQKIYACVLTDMTEFSPFVTIFGRMIHMTPYGVYIKFHS